MKTRPFIRLCHDISRPYRIDGKGKFRLKDFDPADTGDLQAEDKAYAKRALAIGVDALTELQQRLYAQDQWAVLLIFQAMDAAGKDGAIKHVMSGVNPQGCQVYSFKTPSREELDHDFLWRCSRCLPERGRIGIFNRSYYEEVLITRVHPEFLKAARLPEDLVTRDIWEQRFDDIRNFERYLSRNGVLIRKFFLHVSKNEQKKRFIERLEEPDKHWKFSADDVRERKFWKHYQEAYQEMIQNTATREAPWYVVPADNKWFTRAIVAAAVVEALGSLDLSYPEVSPAQLAEIKAARDKLSREK